MLYEALNKILVEVLTQSTWARLVAVARPGSLHRKQQANTPCRRRTGRRGNKTLPAWNQAVATLRAILEF